MPHQKQSYHTRNRKPLAIALSLLIILMAGLLFLYRNFGPQITAGTKNLTIDVVYEDSSTDTYAVTTDAEYLEEAIAEIDDLTVDGSRTAQFGLMILSVNGIEADYAKDHAYWAVMLNGEPSNYGISQQPVLDGGHYQLVYTPAE